MKFSVARAARVGVLKVGPVELETPSLLLSTRKGLPRFISPDLLPSLPSPDSGLLQVSPLHFLEDISSKTISSIGELQKIDGLQGHGTVAVSRDSIQCLPECDSTNKFGASFDTPSGRLLIKPEKYMELISSLRPNIWATLADEVPARVSDERNRTSVDRTIEWVDECIELNRAEYGDVFGAVVGGSDVEERKRCAREVAKRDVLGYWVGGFGLGETMEERPALLKAITENLPEDRPRLISGLSLPDEILQGVAAGIDLFDSSYIYHLTIGGFALTFKRYSCHTVGFGSRRRDDTKINLRATIYRNDQSPIVKHCECYTCKNHTRASINHLLNANEMLAQHLLELHNTHHMLEFFEAIRDSIEGGQFGTYQRSFERNHRWSFEKYRRDLQDLLV